MTCPKNPISHPTNPTPLAALLLSNLPLRTSVRALMPHPLLKIVLSHPTNPIPPAPYLLYLAKIR